MQSAQTQTGLNLSRLAFGCAPVMGRIGRAAALKAMELAFDNGVTHFDVARSYGYGDAEAVLGAFAAGKRDHITIATKFGIRASGTARGLRWIRPAVRRIASRIPYARSAIRAAAGNTLKSGYYRLSDATSSFEESLRQLRTDHADILFIHDCSPQDELSDEVLDYLQNLVRSGRIRAWGIASRREWIAPICEKLPLQPMVVQCAQDILRGFPGNALRHDERPAIFHSPFGAPFPELQKLLAAPALPSALTGIPPGLSRKDGARLLLEGALFMAGNNPVLCSMFNPSHIRDNVDAIRRPRFTQAQLSALVGIAAGSQDDHSTLRS